MAEQIIVAPSENPRCSFQVSKEMSFKYQNLLPNRSRQRVMRVILCKTIDLIEKIGVEKFIESINNGKITLTVIE